MVLKIDQAYHNMVSFKILSRLNVFPMAVHVKAGKISWKTSPGRVKIWRISVAWLALRVIYGAFVLLKLLMNRSDFNVTTFPMQILTFVGHTVGGAAMYCCFISEPQVTAQLFNQLLHKKGFSNPEDRTGYTMHDMILLSAAFHFPLAQVAYAVSLILHPESMQYPFVSLGQGYLKLLVITEEMLVTTLAIPQITFATFIVMLFMQNCQIWLEKRAMSIERRVATANPLSELMTTYKDCRQLQLLVQMFNNKFAFYIFSIKHADNVVCVVSFSLGITLLRQNPTQAAILLILACQIMGDFPGVFEKGFSIPIFTHKLKSKILNICSKHSTQHSRTWTNYHKSYFSKSFKSIPNAAIKVGQFHKLERMSTPRFYGFVLCNVIRMLIAFR